MGKKKNLSEDDLKNVNGGIKVDPEKPIDLKLVETVKKFLFNIKREQSPDSK